MNAPATTTLGLALLVGASASALGQAPSGTVQLDRFFSPALEVSREFFIYLPPSYAREPSRHFPVIYLLHGYGSDEAEWLTHGDIAVVADSLITAGSGPFILVMPDGDRGYWVNWETSPTYEECAASDELDEPPETGCARQRRYGDYIANDLRHHVDSTYRTIDARSGRGLLGISMGGTGSLMLALTNSPLFGAAASLSAVAMPLATSQGPCGSQVTSAISLEDFESARGAPSPKWHKLWGSDTTRWWRHDPIRAARHLLDTAAPVPALRLEVGRDDPLAAGNCAVDVALTAMGMPHQFLVWDGEHDWRAWRKHEAPTLAWTLSQLSTDRDAAHDGGRR